MKRLFYICLVAVLLLSSGCTKGNTNITNGSDSLRGADFFDYGCSLYDLEPYSVLLQDKKVLNPYEFIFDRQMQFTDAAIPQTKPYNFENERLELKYLCTTFSYSEINYVVVDYYSNEDKSILFGFRRGDDLLMNIKRLKTDYEPDRKIYKLPELEKLMDKYINKLSGQKGYKKEVNRTPYNYVGEYLGTYTLMHGEYATPEQIVVNLNYYGDLIEYRRFSDFYGDFSVVFEKTVDFALVEENTKTLISQSDSNKNHTVDNFEFIDKHLFFLADGTLCVGYRFIYEQENSNGVIMVLSDVAFAIIGKLEDGAPYSKRENVLGLRPGDLYFVGGGIFIEINIENRESSFWKEMNRFSSFYNSINKKSKSIVIDGNKIDLTYDITGKFIDLADNKLLVWDYYEGEMHGKRISPSFFGDSDEISFFYWHYGDGNPTEDELRLKAIELIKQYVNVDEYVYEYNSEKRCVTYTKKIGDFYTDATIYANFSTIDKSIQVSLGASRNTTPNIKEPEIDIANLTERIAKRLNEGNNQISNVKIEKMTLKQFFTTVYVDCEVSYKINSLDDSIEANYTTRHFNYIIGEVED